MEPQDRLALIRAKVRGALVTAPTKPKGLYLATNPDAEPAPRMRKGPDPKIPRQKLRYSVHGRDLYDSQRGAGWTRIPDEKPPLTCEVSEHRHEPHYLDRIAEKVPGKLPVVTRSSNSSLETPL